MLHKNEYIYILSCKSLPHIIKIGFSHNYKTNSKNFDSPYPFRVVKKWFVPNAHKLEAKIHDKLSICRTVPNREFFGISPKQAIDVINKAIEDENFDLLQREDIKGTLLNINNTESIGKFIRNKRNELKISQKQLALTSGHGLRVIGEIEKGKPTTQIGIVLELLHLLRVNLFAEDKSYESQKK